MGTQKVIAKQIHDEGGFYGSTGIAVVFVMILGQGPAYVKDVGWALAQQLSKPREFR